MSDRSRDYRDQHPDLASEREQQRGRERDRDRSDLDNAVPVPYHGYGDVNRQRERGQFFGRGPKGYRRSSERIREEVSDRLMISPDVDASDIEVRVENGVVTLSGTVEDRHQKRIAEYIAEDSAGVDDVNNEIRIRHGFWANASGESATERALARAPERDVGGPSAVGGRANAARGAAARRAGGR